MLNVAVGSLYRQRSLEAVWHTPALDKSLVSKQAFLNPAPILANLAPRASPQTGAIPVEALPPGNG